MTEQDAFDRISPLSSPSATRAVLEAHGLATKKSLGQNFLVNDAILRKIVELSALCKDDVVLEVGPGIGTLTIALLKNSAAVVSVERDRDLPQVLRATCAHWSDSFRLVEKDALDLQESDVRVALSSMPGQGSLPMPNKFVANLPYAVAATLVLDYFQEFDWLDSATVMVQSEVADRMCAKPGTKNYGAYTVKLSLLARPAGRFQVGPNNFFPPPRVESSVIRLERRNLAEEGFDVSAEEVKAACTMADAAFASRRKTLSNSCKTFFSGRGAAGADVASRLGDIFEEAGIEPSRRGETLELSEFIALGKALLKAEA